MRKGNCLEQESVTCSAQREGGSYCAGVQWLEWAAEWVAGVPTEGQVAGWIQPQTPQISDPVARGEWSQQPGRQKAEQGSGGSQRLSWQGSHQGEQDSAPSHPHPMQNPGVEGCASGQGWGQEGAVEEGERHRDWVWGGCQAFP